MGFVKILAWVYSKINNLLEPLAVGFLGGAAWWAFSTSKELLIALIIIAIFMAIIGIFLKSRYTKQCPYCGKFYKND